MYFFFRCSKAERRKMGTKVTIGPCMPIILCNPLSYTDNKVYLQLQPARINTPTWEPRLLLQLPGGETRPLPQPRVRVKVGIKVECNHRLDAAWSNERKVGVPGACFGVGMFSSSGCSCSLLYTDLVVELKWQGKGKWRGMTTFVKCRCCSEF